MGDAVVVRRGQTVVDGAGPRWVWPTVALGIRPWLMRRAPSSAVLRKAVLVGQHKAQTLLRHHVAVDHPGSCRGAEAWYSGARAVPGALLQGARRSLSADTRVNVHFRSEAVSLVLCVFTSDVACTADWPNRDSPSLLD